VSKQIDARLTDLSDKVTVISDKLTEYLGKIIISLDKVVASLEKLEPIISDVSSYSKTTSEKLTSIQKAVDDPIAGQVTLQVSTVVGKPLEVVGI